MKVCFFCHDSVSWWRGILLPLWQISFHRNSWVRGKKTELKQNKEKGCEIKENWTKNGRLYGALYSKCRKCDHRCNAKQCAACEWAGRYFMNGGGHVIAAPPKADISHWLSTRTQEISPLKQYRFQSPEMGATSTKTAHTRNTRQICGFLWCGRVCVMPFINVVFYEWRLCYVNESDWEKKRHLELFNVDVAAIDPKRLFVEGNRT